MTREEAIKWMQGEKASLERAPDLNGCPMTDDWQKAIDVYDIAISALRAQQDQSPATGKMMPMTKADRIRAMSDEEIADFVCLNGAIKTPCDIICGGDCNAYATFDKSSMDVCKDIVMKWLQRPAEEDDDHA